MAGKLKVLIVHHADKTNLTMSYHHGWVAHLKTHPAFNCTFLNISGGSVRAGKIKTSFLRIVRPHFVIILHSVFANRNYLKGVWFDMIKAIRAPVVYFATNEYKLMEEKLALIRDLEAALFITATDNPSMADLYTNALHSGCKIISMPHAGLDDRVFYPTSDFNEREIDLGFRAAPDPFYFGHQDRKTLAEYFQQNAGRFGLKTDICYADMSKRFDRAGFAHFLNQCRGQLGTEAGTDYFDIDDSTRNEVNEFCRSNPGVTFEEIEARFFSGNKRNAVSARQISGRNFEAAGTKTVQLLFEGHYNGIFIPDRHYIALKKDFSNIEYAIAKFRDDDFCRNMVENTYAMIKNDYTYSRLLDRLAAELRELS